MGSVLVFAWVLGEAPYDKGTGSRHPHSQRKRGRTGWCEQRAGKGVSDPALGTSGSSRAGLGGVSGSPGLSTQWTFKVSEQIQKPRALLLTLQLKVLQVVRLLLEVTVPLLLALLLPL